MNKLLSDNLWPTLRALGKRRVRRLAAISYVTTTKRVEFGEGDVLVVDATDEAIRARLTDAGVLERALKRGARIYSLPGLHAKVLVLGDIAAIGSANMSEMSAKSLIEAAWVTDSPTAVGMATAFVQKLARQGNCVDKVFVKRIKSLKLDAVRWRTRQSRRRVETRVSLSPHRTWLMGVHELRRDFEEEEGAIEKGYEAAELKRTRRTSELEWLRFTGTSRFRTVAREGDSVVQIWSRKGDERPYAVYKHCPIVHRQEEPTCTRFYIEAPPNAERTTMRWAAFRRLAGRVGIPTNIGPASGRLLDPGQAEALFSLWGR